MVKKNKDKQQESSNTTVQSVLVDAINEDKPIVAVISQTAGVHSHEDDVVMSAALSKLGLEGKSWRDIFEANTLDGQFYGWLNEQFERRSPVPQLVSIADAHFSCVFTSSIDPVLRKLFESDGRQPDTVLVGDPFQSISRSKLNPRIYYLFGMTGAGKFNPPLNKLELNARRTRHAIPMLNMVLDIATPLGIIVVDGFQSETDWLNVSDILGELSLAPKKSVLWYGDDPNFGVENSETFSELIRREIILRDTRPLGVAVAEAYASGLVSASHQWNEPGVISFNDGSYLLTNPSMRLSTEASATIIDDSWLQPLPQLDDASKDNNFYVFHSIPSSNKAIFDGVRYGYSIIRDFEEKLSKAVVNALQNHANETGAIVVSGQSGIGKSISLYRLAFQIREKKKAAVLFARDHIPSAVTLGTFLSEVDKLNQVTLLIVDALQTPGRYNVLLESLRSRGHRIVVLGTSYHLEDESRRHEGKLIFADSRLSKKEKVELGKLVAEFAVGIENDIYSSDHVLAHFFWRLPSSRSRLAAGLVREARSTERVLGTRGQKRVQTSNIGSLGHALIQAGYQANFSILPEEPSTDEQNQAAARLIDYIMVCARMHRWVPVNLVLRALVSKEVLPDKGIPVDLVRHLFSGHDLFRWRYDDNSSNQLLVGARLQLEAQLICDLRLGGPQFETEKIIELIKNSTRAGPEGAEETRFVADIIYALGPDGPSGDRYRRSYYEIALALTELRKVRSIKNARLMLQEATLRRHYIRRNEEMISDEDRDTILDGAREAVDEALSDLQASNSRLKAAQRTIDNLWVERAATYGFLATTAAKRGESPEIVWVNYLAAREAVHKATGKVDSYYPIDISLWLPLEILEHRKDLGLERMLEIKADVLSSLDMVNEDDLDATQVEIFLRQKLRSGHILQDANLSDDAFIKLDDYGSTVGYFFKARSSFPFRGKSNHKPSSIEIENAKKVSTYLLRFRDKVLYDPRCMRLLLDAFWLWKSENWLFSDIRQPIPSSESDRRLILEILSDLSFASGEDFQPKFQYLKAMLLWLLDDERRSIQEFRKLARDTEYVESKRVLPRHIITDFQHKPIVFSGVIERQVSDRRWSINVRDLNRSVDLISGRWSQDISVGVELRGFNVGFNYIGPIALVVQ